MSGHLPLTDERAFEMHIEQALVGSTLESRKEQHLTDPDAQTPSDRQYYWGQPQDMDKALALDLRRLWSFLTSTQQQELDKHHGGNLRDLLPKRLSKLIDDRGVIELMRKGIDIDNIHLTLFYPRPSAADGIKSHQDYARNQFSLTRQQTFSVQRPGLELDMVLFVNGIPLLTFELKNPWTHQTARMDGQNQYKSPERDPKEPLLRFGRCLAHFTLDKDEIYFTTRLQGAGTYFMPFNKGLPNGAGAGNPVNPDGFATAYLWQEVLQKDVLSDIIQNYVLFDYGEAKTQKKVPHLMKNAQKLIFPRYHQLSVVNELVRDVAFNGIDAKTYLIQHSAGSGKSNSITWLAYKLIKTCPSSPDAKRSHGLDTQLFSSVLVVTDRRLLDRQITDNIMAFGHSQNTVAHADTSADLKNAIMSGKRIIITTIQKFPFICDTISDVSNRNFAIIIDEAHSSQTGIAADKMNASVQRAIMADGEVTTDSILQELMLSRKMSSNCAYFAFTATPKKETLERFGTKNPDGSFAPFHLYSMKQAIEEGFILDVLTNYTTYKSYYEIVKSIDDNPEYRHARAQRALKKAVEREPRTISAKAEQMLAHFDANIFRTGKLRGKAKAMVVTKDIECAVRHYHALMSIKNEKKLPYGILIAFSGNKQVDGNDYTEAQLNGFADTRTAEEFNKDENRILVVANKYLTGFDQPKLCAMYIDKPLDGVLAVQALSRLNRTDPSLGKRSEDLFVLDFYNTAESIKDSFDPYYTATSLSEATDVNLLHDLRNTLLGFDVFSLQEVEDFNDLFFHSNGGNAWTPIIDKVTHRFCHEIEWADDSQADFKIKCKQFVKVYSRMAAIIDFENLDWEKLFWFLRLLIPGLRIPGPGENGLRDLLDNVDLNTYGLRRTELNTHVDLNPDEAVLDPNKASMAGAGQEDELSELDRIVQEFNNRHFQGWEATPYDQRTKLISMVMAIRENADYNNLVVGNPDPDAVETTMNSIIDQVIRDKRSSDMSLYKQYLQNKDFKHQLRHVLERMLITMEANPESITLLGTTREKLTS